MTRISTGKQKEKDNMNGKTITNGAKNGNGKANGIELRTMDKATEIFFQRIEKHIKEDQHENIENKEKMLRKIEEMRTDEVSCKLLVATEDAGYERGREYQPNH